jgi:hypothetical protein
LLCFVLLDGGALGIIGRSGWYIPPYLTDNYPTLLLDFWRAYQTIPEARSLFPPSGSTPDSQLIGRGRQWIPSWCILETSPIGCVVNHTTYAVDRTCNVTVYNPDCMELYAIDETYDVGLLQQQVRNNHLNISIPFFSEDNFYDVIQQRYYFPFACPSHQPYRTHVPMSRHVIVWERKSQYYSIIGHHLILW